MTTDKAAAPVGAVPQDYDQARRTANYWKAELAEANKELSEIAAALPGVAFMDPPDGGSPTIAEQVRRMAAALRESDAAIASQAARMGELEQDAARWRHVREMFAEEMLDSLFGLDTYPEADPTQQLDAACDEDIASDAAIDKLRGEKPNG